MKSKTDETLAYVQYLTRRLKKSDIRGGILTILFDLGFTHGMDGTKYLRVVIARHYARITPFFLKGIFPAVSNLDDGFESCQYIDQAMRRAIKAAWAVRDPEVWSLYFPHSRSKKAKCPSNKEFIATISSVIELWQSCKEEDYDNAI